MKIYLTESELSRVNEMAQKILDLTLEATQNACQDVLENVSGEAIILVHGDYNLGAGDRGNLFDFALTSFGGKDDVRAVNKFKRRSREYRLYPTGPRQLIIVPDFSSKFDSAEQTPTVTLYFTVYLEKEIHVVQTPAGRKIPGGHVSDDSVRLAIKDIFRKQYD